VSDALRVRVNGEVRDVSGAPTRTLLRVLREDLELGGPREGCGIGVCGACTVLLDGRALSACLLLAAQVEGHDVTTVEGLADGDRLHPVQQAFIDHSAFQCGFCTPGFLVSAVALLERERRPTDDEIRDELSGTLCRCGCYRNILEAVRSAARPE